MADETMTTYILDLTDGGQRKVTVPSAWKVTFGPLVVGRGSGDGGDARLGGTRRSAPGGIALRFYESKENQRAIFTDVVSFRDSTIKIEERVKSTRNQTLYKDTPEGRKQVVVEATVKEWRDPDDNYQPEDEYVRPLLTLEEAEEGPFYGEAGKGL